MERAELEGSLRLGTLRNAAAAMNCDLLYVLVPRMPLDTMVRQQAEFQARVQIAAEQDAIERERAQRRSRRQQSDERRTRSSN